MFFTFRTTLVVFCHASMGCPATNMKYASCWSFTHICITMRSSEDVKPSGIHWARFEVFSDAEEDSRSLACRHVVSYVGATFLDELSAYTINVAQFLLASLPIWRYSATWKSAHQNFGTCIWICCLHLQNSQRSLPLNCVLCLC
jgi:hypothetical protein